MHMSNFCCTELSKFGQIDDWRDISLPRVLVKTPRVRMLGANSAVTGFGNEYEALSKNEAAHMLFGLSILCLKLKVLCS